MKISKENTILISGASIAGLSTAYWMNRLGYQVTVVEIAKAPRTAGAAVDLRGDAVEITKHMGIFDELKANRLNVEMISFKNADDTTAGSILLSIESSELPDEEIEIERNQFITILLDCLKKEVEFIFGNSVSDLEETTDHIKVSFKEGPSRSFDLVIGCDGTHSGIRKIAFGPETAYTHFLQAYFSITTINKLLVPENTMQMYNVPDKAITLNAYRGKTDIIFGFVSENEIFYDYRDIDQQKQIIQEQFSGQSWRAAALLEDTLNSDNFYFDKFCQIKMPSWTKGRIVLVGDAAYCASPAAGMGASLSMKGAATLAATLLKHNGNFAQAFLDYNQKLRPFIEEVQSTAEMNVRNNFIPRTEEAIQVRNAHERPF